MSEKKPKNLIDPAIEESSPADAVDSDLKGLLEQFQKTTDERDEYKDQLLRTMADFQNFRKRVAEEKKQVEERANERLIVALLPVLDNFERAIAGIDAGTTVEAITEGIRAIDRQLRTVLDSQKVKRIDSVGHAFDPEHHDALAIVQSEEHEEGTVLEEVESGYKIGDRVIRPARVRVSTRRQRETDARTGLPTWMRGGTMAQGYKRGTLRSHRSGYPEERTNARRGHRGRLLFGGGQCLGDGSGADAGGRLRGSNGRLWARRHHLGFS